LSFDVDKFVAACRAERHQADAPERIAALLREAVANPTAIATAIQRRRAASPSASMADIFFSDEALTIYHLAFPSNVYSVPHDHAGWAVIGVYSGIEAFNVYQECDGRLEKTGRRILNAPSVEILAPDLIHDIDNPSGTVSGSIHVYSNRHFDIPDRRIWRDGEDQPEAFTLQRSFEYGMERTARRRRELGLSGPSGRLAPDVEALRKRSD